MTGKPTFTCRRCGQTHEMQRTEADAIADYERSFGVPFNPSEAAVICDDCHKVFDQIMDQAGFKMPDGTYTHPALHKTRH